MNMSQHAQAFAHVSFFRYWIARFFATFGAQIISVSVAWQVYDVSRDPFDLGLIGLVQFLPLLLLVLVTGATSDHYGHRKVMLVSIVVEILCALSILSWAMLPNPPIWMVLCILTVFGSARAFFGPAVQSLVVSLVPKEDFANAIAWNSSAWQIATIVGPVVGGLLYGLGPILAYSISAFLFLVSLVLIRLLPEAPKSESPRKVDTTNVLAGLRFIFHEKIVLGAISLDLVAVLLGGAVALLPVYARDILELGPAGLGLLRAAPGIGAILTGMFLATSPVRDKAGHILLMSVGLFGAFTTVFAVSNLVWLSILALALVGATDMVSVVIRETLLQLWTPDEVRGRVNAVNHVFLGASNELGEFRAGLMAAWLGAVPAVAVGGIGAVGVALSWCWLFPQLRQVRYLDIKG
jgi:MFS family permease